MSAFPLEPLPVRVRILIDGSWIDMGPMSGNARLDPVNRLPAQEFTITFGKADETSVAQPANVQVRLWNGDGRLTPMDRRSPWWRYLDGGWDLNTQFQILVGTTVVFWGEVSKIAPGWSQGDLSDPTLTALERIKLTDVDPRRLGFSDVTVTASGILRRLRQRKKPLRSPLQRLATNPHNVALMAGYWPFEDAAGATTIASGLPQERNEVSHATGTTVGFSLATATDLPGSDPLPGLPAGQSGSWAVPLTTSGPLDDGWVVDHYFKVGAVPKTGDQWAELMTVETSGDVVTRWVIDMVVEDVAKIRVRAFDPANVAVIAGSFADPIAFDLIGNVVQIQLRLQGGDWILYWRKLGDYFGWQIGGSFDGAAGYPTRASGSYTNMPGDVMFGHVSIYDASLIPLWAVPADEGWSGEEADSRMTRLCIEEGHSIIIDGAEKVATRLGVQRSKPFIALIEEAALSDGGILTEDRSTFALRYVVRQKLYNQPVRLTLDAHQQHITVPLEPVRDDQSIRNDMKGSRTDGSSRQLVNPASEDKYGTYDDSAEWSLESDNQVIHHTGWALHLGLVNRLRYPGVSMNLAVAPQLRAGWLAMRPGKRVHLVNLPPQHPVEVADQLLQGWQETLGPFVWMVKPNLAPAAGWTVGRWGISKWNTRHSRLTVGVNVSATTITVTTPGIPWTANPASFPIALLLGGCEEVLATSISGPTSPQTMTVIRDRNGLGRGHSPGTEVTLAEIAVVGL